MRVLLFLLSLGACLLAEAAGPNVLILLSDDQRPDAFGAAGNAAIHTPNLDKLAARGMRFTRAGCSNPICLPSRSEILTGLHGWKNGIAGMRGDTRKRTAVPAWPLVFKRAGYRTGHVGKWHVPGKPADYGFTETAGFYRGGGGKWWDKSQTDWKGSRITGYAGWVFQSPDGKQKFPERGVGLAPDISRAFADAALQLINKKSEQPWFLMVNFTAPHDPLLMPPGLEQRYTTEDMPLPPNFQPEHPFDTGNLGGRDETLLPPPRTKAAVKDLLRMYYAVVTGMDQQIGRILDQLDASGQAANTVVVFTSDHGIAVGSHGLRGKQNMYEHTFNVPMVFAGPGIKGGRVSDAQVVLRDLYPTTCELVGLEVPAAIATNSFASVLRGEKKEHRTSVFGIFRDSQRMVRTQSGWKLVHYPLMDRTQLFHLPSDPHERDDLSAKPDHRTRLIELRSELDAWRKHAGDPLLRKTFVP